MHAGCEKHLKLMEKRGWFQIGTVWETKVQRTVPYQPLTATSEVWMLMTCYASMAELVMWHASACARLLLADTVIDTFCTHVRCAIFIIASIQLIYHYRLLGCCTARVQVLQRHILWLRTASQVLLRPWKGCRRRNESSHSS